MDTRNRGMTFDRLSGYLLAPCRIAAVSMGTIGGQHGGAKCWEAGVRRSTYPHKARNAGHVEEKLTLWSAQLYARVAGSAEGVTLCELFRSAEALLQAVREPLPHAAVQLREIPLATQQHVQGRAVLRLELSVCHASSDVLLTSTFPAADLSRGTAAQQDSYQAMTSHRFVCGSDRATSKYFGNWWAIQKTIELAGLSHLLPRQDG